MKHEQHYSAPFALSSREMHPMRTILRSIALVSAISFLAACGNSTEVENNISTGGAGNGISGPTYLGPAPLTDEVQRFKTEFWNPLAANDRCGQCHTSGGAAANFPFVDLLDINAAFAAATSTNNTGQLIVDRSTPGISRAVIKVAEGHQCWGSNSDNACADIIESYIDRWTSGTSTTGGRSIALSPPDIFFPGESRNFPDTTDSFRTNLHTPILVPFCAECHSDTSETPQAPFFASDDINVAYAAAKSKINLDALSGTSPNFLPLALDSPEQSRFVARVLELHNCWTASCEQDATDMRDAIFDFASDIPLTAIGSELVTSAAMNFANATLASGGNRYENDQIALWEFKTGQGNQAFDTSGIDPAMTLTFNGSVSWILGYGIEFSNGGFAAALPQTSEKLTNLISLNNSYSIEAWVIPANVTQEDRRIISYSDGSGVARNFSMSQTLYQYEYLNRSTNTDAEGRDSLLSLDEDEDLQSALQHVVFTFDPVNGRRMYVNGVFTDDVDSTDTQGGTLLDWDDSFAFVLGGETGDVNSAWNGKLRMVAIHNSALTAEQIAQNFSVGVGQKYFMLFSVGDLLGLPQNEAFVMMQTELYDNTAYLFNNPVFVNLNGDYIPQQDISIEGMRLGINGREAGTGQAFGNLSTAINSTDYTADGQTLSRLGTVIPVGKGPENDEFFLTFELIGNNSNTRIEDEPVAIDPSLLPEADPVSGIGVKTFDEINASMSKITGIPTTNARIAAVFDSYEQQLPSIEDANAFLASHQMGVAQMAMTYCDQLVQLNRASFFSGFDFTQTPITAFDSEAKRRQIIDPLLVGIMNLDNATGHNLATQADPDVLRDMIGSPVSQNLLTTVSDPARQATYDYNALINTMVCDADTNTAPPACDQQRTQQMVIAICAATLGSAMTIIQ